MQHTLIERLISRLGKQSYHASEKKDVKVKNTTPRKQPHAGYFHVSTKVVTWKDQDGVGHEGLIGVTYTRPHEKKPSKRAAIRNAGGKTHL